MAIPFGASRARSRRRRKSKARQDAGWTTSIFTRLSCTTTCLASATPLLNTFPPATLPAYKTLSSAAAHGHTAIVCLLLDHGADVDEVHDYHSGWEYVEGGVVAEVGSPLFLAAQASWSAIVRLFLECGAEPNTADICIIFPGRFTGTIVTSK